METLRERIKRHEGRSLHPYKCTSGALTIGYGRNLSARGISGFEAEILFENDFDRAHFYFEKLPDTVKAQCNPQRKDVLVEMLFQLGHSGVLGFKKMLKAIEMGDFEKAADEMLNSKWALQTPSRCRELADIMRDG